eukprot:112379_1
MATKYTVCQQEIIDFTPHLIEGYLKDCRMNVPMPTVVVHLIESFYNVSSDWIQLESELNGNNRKEIDDDIDNIGCIQGCKATAHKKAWLLTILMLFFPISYIICWNIPNKCQFPCSLLHCNDPYWLIVFGILYMIYVSESFGSSTAIYLSNTYTLNNFMKCMDKVLDCTPEIYCDISVGHYVQAIDSDGRNVDEWVATYIGTKYLQLSSWKNTSNDLNLLQLNKHKFVKINIDHQLLLANEQTALKCIEMMEEYKNEHKYKDEQYQFDKGWKLKMDGEYEGKFLFKSQTYGLQSNMISIWCYVLLSLLGCSVCYRTWFTSVCARKRYRIIKEVEL